MFQAPGVRVKVKGWIFAQGVGFIINLAQASVPVEKPW